MHFTTKPSRENLPVNQNRLTVKLWRRIACAVLCFVLLGSNLTVAFATEGSTATAAVEQSEASYTLVLTHHFQDGTENGLKVEETVTLAGADFPEGVCDLSRYARTYEQAAAETPGSVSLNSFVEGKAAAEIVYTVQEGLTAGLDDNGAVVFQAAAQEPEPDPEPVNPQPEPEPEPDPEPVNPQPEPEPEQPEVITYTLTLTCRFTDAAGKVVDMPQTVTLTGADFTDNGYSVTAPQYDHAAANSPSVTISLDSFDAHHKAAVTIAYTVQEGWTVSAGEDGGVTFAEVTQPQEEDSLMLALTHEFYQNGECVATTYSLHELTAGDFNGEGVLSTNSFAEKSDKITLTSAPSLSMEEAEDGYLVGTLCYEVKAGWKMVLKENAVSGRDDGISLFSEFQGGGNFGDYEFVAADVVTVKLQFKYSNTGGLAGVDASAPQTVELQATKKTDGSYELSAYDLPTVNGFRIVLNPSELNKYVVSPPTGKETPEELKRKLENGDFNVNVNNPAMPVYYSQTNPPETTNPTYQNIYSDQYNQAWNSARRLKDGGFTAEATGSNDKKGATPLTDPSLHITLTEAQFKSAVTNGLDITVYYRRNATWYTVNHWVPKTLVAGGVPAGAEEKTEDGTVYVRLDQETIQGRVGANTAAKAKVGGKYELVSAVPFNQVQIANTNTVVDIYYASASSYRIIFNTDYTYIPRQQVNMGSPVDFTKVTSPQRAGYTFGGWQYLKKGATPDLNGEYAVDDYIDAGTAANPALTVNEELISKAKLVASGDVMAIHLYPKWVPDTTTVRVILWTENLTGEGDVQAVASGGNTAYYTNKYANYGKAPVTHYPQLGTSDSNYSNMGSFTVTVPTDSPLLNNTALVDDVQNKVTSQFATQMGQASGIDVANFYTQNDFEIIHEGTTAPTTASADGKTTIYVYFTRNIYTLQFHYYGTVNGQANCVALNTTGYSYNSECLTDGGFNFNYSGGNVGTENFWQEPIGQDAVAANTVVPETITITAKYGANLNDVWPVSRTTEIVHGRRSNSTSTVAYAQMISWSTTAGKYRDNALAAYRDNGKGEPTIMGVYGAMSAEMIADPTNPETTHHLVAYWNDNGTSYYRYNHCLEIPDLDVSGMKCVSIYNSSNVEADVLYLVPTDNDTIQKYGFTDLLEVSDRGGTIDYDTPGGFYAVRANTVSGATKYYAISRRVDIVSRANIRDQNPSARLHLTRVSDVPSHSTEHVDTDGACWVAADAGYTANPIGSAANPYDLYFYYNRDPYTITYMAPSSNTSVTAANEVTLGTIELPYGAQVTPKNYGFKLDYETKNTDAAYTSGAYAWTPAADETAVCPDRAPNGTKAWTFKGWALGPGGVNMLWNNENGNMTGETLAAEGNLRLYAIWDAPTYTVTFHLNGGKIDGDADDIVDEVPANTRYTANGQIPRPLWEGHTLVGWYNANANGEMVDAQGDVTTNVAQAVAFDFDRAVSSDLHAVAFWDANTTEQFNYTVYHVTLSLKEGDNRPEILILNDEIVETGGAVYYLLEKDEYTDQDYIQNGTLNLSSVKIDGYVPQATNKSLVMSEGANGVYNVIFYYDPVVSHSYTVRFVRAGKENSATGADIVLKQENIQADSVVVTPRSAQATELTTKGYRLVVKYGNGYKAVDKNTPVKWYDETGAEKNLGTLVGDNIPDTITYLVEPIPYTISYTNAVGSPAGAEAALKAVTAADNTPVASANGKNPTQYTTEDADITVMNPANVLSNGIWYRFKNWMRGADTTDTAQTKPDSYNPLKIDQGSTGNLTFVANWEAIPAANLGQLTVSKTVTGTGADQTKVFTFTVTLSDTTVNGTIGGMTFADGVATVTLKHNQSATATLPAGITYTVTETAVNGYRPTGGNTRTGTIPGNNGTAPAPFENQYTPTPATATGAQLGINGTKTLDGRDFRAGDTFSFAVRAITAGAPLSTSNEVEINPQSGNKADFQFGTFTFTNPGTYQYVISEVIPQQGGTQIIPGITYDTTGYRLTVTVTDDGNGALQVSHVKIESSPRIEPDTWEVKYDAGTLPTQQYSMFTNTYDATLQKVTFTGHKILENKELAANDFRFILKALSGETADGTEVDVSAIPMPAGSVNGVCEHGNLATNGITFAGITYRTADVGNTYRYTITEKQPTEDGSLNGKPLDGAVLKDGAWVYKGITYSNHVHTVDVKVNTKANAAGDEEILVAVSHDSHGVGAMQNFEFINTYNAVSNTLSLTGTKNITGRDFQTGDQFTFDIKPLDGAPAPKNDSGGDITQVTLAPGSGKEAPISFGTLQFTQADMTDAHGSAVTEKTFRYEIAEAEGQVTDMVYDTAKRTVEITVTDDGTGALTAALTSPQTDLVWNNRFVARANLMVTKTVAGNGGDQRKDFLFTVTLTDESGKDISGDFSGLRFTLRHGEKKVITGIPVGTSYTVVEAEANRNGYVTMATDNGRGTIQENGSVVDFTNTRDIKPGKLTVTKTVTGLKGDKTKAFTFVVKLSDESVNGVYGEMTFVNGRAEFTLKHGERKTAEGLPAGVAYTVKEGDNEGYTVRKIGDTGEIQEGRTAYARFTNRKTNLDNQPRTGDDTKLELWAGLTVLCFLGAVVSLVVSKKRKNKYNR